jgi:hypothetical protein
MPIQAGGETLSPFILDSLLSISALPYDYPAKADIRQCGTPPVTPGSTP